MKYQLVVDFKDGTSKTFTVDTYSHANGILELVNCIDLTTTVITIYPFTDLSKVVITQIQVGA